MKILVTGGAGFIGSHLVDAFLAAGHQVAVLDDLSTGKKERLVEGVPFYQVDLRDRAALEQVFVEFQPEVVDHHAAQISVVHSMAHPAEDAERNILATINLIEVGNRFGLQKLIFPSSGGTVYGVPEQLPCDEQAPARPASAYGLAKHTVERYLGVLAKFPYTVLRYGNVYGPRQDPEGEAGVCAIFAPRMLANQPVKIFGDGSQQRDYVFIEDVVRANLLALEKGEGEVVNIGTGVGTTTRQVFETIQRVTGYALEAVQAPAREGELQAVYLDIAKAERVLGWQPEVSFEQGIAKTVAWYREQQ